VPMAVEALRALCQGSGGSEGNGIPRLIEMSVGKT